MANLPKKLYRLNHAADVDEGEEGEDWDQWFGSLEEAKKMRTHYIRQGRSSVDQSTTLSIDRITLKPTLPTKALLLAALNRRGFVKETVEVVPAVTFYKGVAQKPVVTERRVREERARHAEMEALAREVEVSR